MKELRGNDKMVAYKKKLSYLWSRVRRVALELGLIL